jgi:hypothetical protein
VDRLIVIPSLGDAGNQCDRYEGGEHAQGESDRRHHSTPAHQATQRYQAQPITTPTARATDGQTAIRSVASGEQGGITGNAVYFNPFVRNWVGAPMSCIMGIPQLTGSGKSAHQHVKQQA